jgi:hypothetical protein
MFFPLIAALTVLSPDRPLVLKELAVGAYRLSAYYVSTNAMVLPFDFLFSACVPPILMARLAVHRMRSSAGCREA